MDSVHFLKRSLTKSVRHDILTALKGETCAIYEDVFAIFANQADAGHANYIITRKLKMKRPLSLYFAAAMLMFSVLLTEDCSAQTLPGSVSASWMGQSLGTGTLGEGTILGIHVQALIQGMVTGPDGTCYTNSGWDEAGNDCSWYKNGQFVGRDFFSGMGGEYKEAVAVNGTTEYQGANNDIYYWSLGQSATVTPSGPVAVSSANSVTGLAANSSYVYAAVAGDNKVYVLNASSLAAVSSWTATNPHQICVEPSGNLWVICGTTIEHYSPTGTYLGQQITSVSIPSALCLDNSGDLLVADQGTDDNIKIFSSVDTSPTLSSTFGVQGGVLGQTGTSMGVISPLHFNQITGVGVDSSNNIYVASNRNVDGGGSVLESYTSSGTQNWVLYGLEFEDVGSMDPTTNGADVYTTERHYTIDYTKPQAQQWAYKGYTWNPHLYPNDPRNTSASGMFPTAGIVRRIGGNPILFTLDQTGDSLTIYRFNSTSSGEIAIPSGFISPSTLTGGWPANQPTTGAWIWRDTNGNGSPDSGEFVQPTGDPSYSVGGTYIDDSGNIWETGASPNLTITEYPCQGLDSEGNPIYNYTSAVSYTGVTDFTEIDRCMYDVASDTMYLSGYTSSLTVDTWGLAGKMIAQYPNWSHGNRTAAWKTTFPYQYDPSNSGNWNLPKAVCIAGSYIFVAYYNVVTAHCDVYLKSTGASVGSFTYPISNVQGNDVDSYYGLQAFLRSDGEYEITQDGYRGAKIMLLHWYPGPGTIAPTNLTATSGNQQVSLSWTGATQATSYNVYRGLVSGGESGTPIATGVTTTSYTDNTVSNGVAYYYTVDALNGSSIIGVSNEASATPSEGSGTGLPPPWVDTDIGSPSPAGSASYASPTFTVNGSGGDIWSNSDQFNYMYQSITGDTTIIARVKTESAPSNWTKVGVMIRESLNASSYFVDMLATPSQGINQEYRNASNTTGNGVETSGAAPIWLKLVRAGGNVTSYYAADVSGSPGTWTQLGATEPIATGTVTAGLAVCSHTGNSLATATFDNVTVSGTTPAAPAAPTGLGATGSAGQVALSWTASTGATSYNVYRGTTSGGESGTALAIGVGATTYADTSVIGGVTYYYKVTATNSGGSSGYSNEASATPSVVAPPAPTGLAAIAGNAQAALSWSASSGAASYNLYRGTSAGGESGTAIATGITGTTYTNTGLTNGVTYYYKAAAVNTGGTSPYSNEASVTPQIPAPPPPTGLGATAGVTQVSLSWTASSGAASYNLYRGTSAGGESGTALVMGLTGTTYVNTGLTAGTTYYYKAAAVNAGGTSSTSNEASATAEAPIPAAPTSLTATPGNAQVSLSWPSSSGATSYSIYRGTSSGGESTTAIASVTTTTYVNTGLTNGTLYYYKVTAVNSTGASGYSPEASATPQVSAPPPPTGLSATAGSAQITLGWTASSGATSYNVYRGTSAGGESTTAIATGVTSTSYLNTGLANGTTYYYKVTAVNAGGASGYSNEASGTPAAAAPPAPTSLTAAAGNTVVTLAWTASSGATSYNVYRGTSSGGESTTAIATGLIAPNYGDAGISNGTTYYYKVAAVNSGGTSGYSNEASATPSSGAGGALTANIAHAASAPTIDGNVDSVWSSATSYSLGKLAFGSTSNSASYQAMWDATNLYFLVTVSDSALFSGSPDWNGDAVELYIDATNSKTTSYGSTDFQYVYGWSHSSISEYAHGATTGVVAAQVNTTGGYRMEYSIPWSTLGVTPVANNHIGLDVANDDANTSTSGRIAQIIWNGTSQDYANPSLFGTGTLVPAPGSAPSAPTGLTAASGNAQVSLSWTASSGATSYNIYRGTSAGGESTTAIATGVTTTSYVNTGLSNGTAYFYKVTAVNSYGASGYSNEASATPSASIVQLTGTATASSSTDGLVATDANDGYQSTYWESAPGAYPATLTIDLGANHSISQVVVELPAAWSTRTQTFSVQGSTDNVTYSTLVASSVYTFAPGSNNIVTIAVPTSTARYVQLNVTANSVANGAQAAEFQIWGN